MAEKLGYERDKNGQRFVPGGIDTVTAVDSLGPNRYAFLQNIRGFKKTQIVSRSTESDPVVTGLPTPVHSLALLNDTTPSGPVGGFVRVIGAAGVMWVDSTQIASGYSGSPISLCPFRPNTSVRPWIYTGDPSQAVTISTKFLIDNTPTTFNCFGATKIQSDKLIFKTGIKEPQVAPVVTTEDTVFTGTDILPATAIPWTNVGGENPSPYNYGQTNGADGTAPIIITGDAPELIAGSTIVLTVTGTANVNGNAAATPATPGPTSAGYPGSTSGISGTPAVVMGAFTDTAGNVVAPGGSLPLVFFIGAGTTITVPPGAAQLQIGIDSLANNFSANSGSFTVNWSVTVAAIATVISTLGDVTADVWGTPPPAGGGSPHSGPVGAYIWKNPNDSGSGISRSLTNPVPDASPTNNSWELKAPSSGVTLPVDWNVLNPDGSVASTIQLYNPALETEGFQDFNVCLTGSIFVPAAGTYQFILTYKDQIMFGISGGATAVVTGGSAAVPSSRGQTITVINSLPILFVGGGTSGSDVAQARTTNLNITFPAAGVYQVEGDWDYWDKSNAGWTPPGAAFIMQAVSTSPNSPTIPPLPVGVRTGVSYRYIYRSTATGAISNPSPESPIQDTPVLANTVTPIYSTDPQVDKIDYYRIDEGLDNFTYVATGPNTNPPTPITDETTDLEVANNKILEFDNYEPFPVIDQPRKGRVDVTGGVITWISGDQFNTRWLPGTIILIGYPTSLPYVFIARPTSATTVTIPGVPDGTNLVYEIPEPDLAAQPLPYLWGPTDNVAYMFGVGDELNPGTLYFTKGNNPDSAPQTNQIPVTSPDEALINGVKTAAMAMVWTAERRWLIYPTFDQALATVEGVVGTAFNVVEATGSKGLYIPHCVCTDGGNVAFFRAKDGIYASEFGGQDVCITDDIYNLFPREGVVPQPITIAGNTIFPPNDLLPDAQKLSFGDTVLFYDYSDVNGDPRTLVYDMLAKGWSVDEGQFPFTIHSWEDGPNSDTVMVGCTDGTVRLLGSGNPEVATSIVIPGCQNAGDARAFKRLGDLFIKAIAQASNPINVALYANRYAQALAGFTPTTLVGTGSLLPYIVDFADGFGDELIDIGLSLTWPTAAGNLLDLWQPSFTMFPEATQDRPTSWEDCGTPGNKFVQGLLLEMNSFGNPKAIAVQRSDDFAVFTPNESPVTAAHQQIVPLTFTPPFLAHQVRIISTDGVLWRHGPDLGWRCQWAVQPMPESTVEWQTELTSLGGLGWQHLRMMNLEYISTADIVLAFVVDVQNGSIAPASITIPSSGGAQTKMKLTMTFNKWKLLSFRASSSAPMMIFQEGMECWIKPWGSSSAYEKMKPYGGQSSPAAEV